MTPRMPPPSMTRASLREESDRFQPSEARSKMRSITCSGRVPASEVQSKLLAFCDARPVAVNITMAIRGIFSGVEAGGEADPAAPVELLADLQELFAATAADKLATAAIIHHLIRLEERSWAEYAAGRPLTPRHLAQLLEGFRIKAKQIRQGAATRKGYLRSDFTDAFGRYLPPVPSDSGVTGGRGGGRRIGAAGGVPV